MPEPDPKERLNRLIAFYSDTLNAEYPETYQPVKAKILNELWHRIHALQVEIVGEGI